MSTPSTSTPVAPANRHAPTALERQRAQLEKLLKDPAKPVHIPAPPKEKTLRPPREMMKNVQGSSAGAGSGEFHVYKASRRREYERLKMMEETTQKEASEREFEQKKRQWEEEADAKTAKNRAKRQKKKGKAKVGKGNSEAGATVLGASADAPLKKRRLVNGKELVFKRPGEESEGEESEGELAAETRAGDDGDDDVGRRSDPESAGLVQPPPKELILDTPRIVIHDD